MGDNYSNKASDDAFEEIDADGSGELSIAEFKEGILKSNKNITSDLPRK
jgi:Ca2+-binding EF-hand superfamily protein